MKNLSIIEECFKNLMVEGLGLDLSDPNLLGTPKRIAKMYSEMFSGIDSEFKGLTVFPNDKQYDEIILFDNIFFVSMCSHHFLPFYGHAWVAYIPDKVVVGASKPARVINHFAAKPHLQENLCNEVTSFLFDKLDPKGIMVVMRAEHGCMKCRGVKQYDGSGMLTSSVKGVFKSDLSAKSEALSLISLSMK